MVVKDLNAAIYDTRVVQESEVPNGLLCEANNQPGVIFVLPNARESMQDWCVKPNADLVYILVRGWGIRYRMAHLIESQACPYLETLDIVRGRARDRNMIA